MIAVKVECDCGQRYAFDVEPVHGRMPAPVACPVCGADGTGKANAVLAQSSPPAPFVAVARPAVSVAAAVPVAVAAVPRTPPPVPLSLPRPVAVPAVASAVSLAGPPPIATAAPMDEGVCVECGVGLPIQHML